ncbi:MAG: glycosyltransferase family 4 protein [Thermoplasmata archaeon]
MDHDYSNSSPSIALVLQTNILLGSGIEKAALYYIINTPEEIKNITFVHTDLLDKDKKGLRLDKSYLDVINKRCNIINIKNDYWKIDASVANFPILFRYLIYYPSLIFLRFTIYRKIYDKIGRPDIVYLFRNDFSFFFDKSVFMVGSTHGWYPQNNNFLRKINKLTALIFRKKISAYHSFPIWTKEVKDMFPDKEVLVVPNGVETDLIKPIILQNKKIKFLYVARLEKCKGILTLIDSWDGFKENNDLELNIAGGGSLEKEIKDKVSNMKNVVYYGIVNQDELYRIYGESDIFVYPSTCDSVPLVILEALSAGCQVITNDRFKGSFKEFEEIGAITFCEPNSESFSKAMEKSINEIELIRSKKNELHKTAVQFYDWKNVVKKLYDEMIISYNKKHYELR